MKYLFIGAGAIGSYLGGSLLDAGCDVCFLEKPEYATSLAERGISVKLLNRRIHLSPVRVFSSPEDAFRTPVDVVVFAIKSFDTEEAAREISGYSDSISHVLCLQNGVENEPILEKYFGKDKVIGGSVTSSIGRLSAGDVVLEKQRGIGMEDAGEVTRRIAHDFNQAGLNARIFPRRLDLKWSKMLSNLLVNSTCAILDMTPHDVLRSKDLFHVEMRLFIEALDVMRAQGIRPINLPRVPMQTLAWIVRLLPEVLLQPLLYKPLGGGRGGKMPSLHIDLHHGRRDSEVVVLNGAVTRFGHANQIPTPVNEALTATMLTLVASPEMQEKFSHNPGALLDAIREKEGSYVA